MMHFSKIENYVKNNYYNINKWIYPWDIVGIDLDEIKEKNKKKIFEDNKKENIESVESEDEIIVDYIMDFIDNNKKQSIDKFDIFRAIIYLLENMYSSYASSLLVMCLRGMTEAEASNMLDFIRKKYESSKDDVFRFLLRELLFDLFAEPGNKAIMWIKKLDNINDENKLFLKRYDRKILDKNGKIIGYEKKTYAPDERLVHNNDKFNNVK